MRSGGGAEGRTFNSRLPVYIYFKDYLGLKMPWITFLTTSQKMHIWLFKARPEYPDTRPTMYHKKLQGPS